MTLARLAGGDLARYKDDADAALSTFAVLAEERGPRFAFARVAAHGGLAVLALVGPPALARARGPVRDGPRQPGR